MNIRGKFPILQKHFSVDGKELPLVYFDNAATTQKPESVIERVCTYYREENANVHRSIHLLGEEATRLYEQARVSAARFIGAADHSEIIFTKGTTEAVNLAAWAWGRKNLSPGDGILLTEMEHHSNLVPWQLLAQATGAHLHHIPVADNGELDLKTLDDLLSRRIRLTSFTWMSNVLGTVNPVRQLCAKAHEAGSLVFVDGAQGIAHARADMQDFDCDFFAFSAHKMFGPTGTGVLYARKTVLDRMEPYQGGGDMISAVWLDRAEWNEAPYKFEAGTPNVAGVLGMEQAMKFIDETGYDIIERTERELQIHLAGRLSELSGLTRYGTAGNKGPVESFNLKGIHPHDAAHVLSRYGIAVRAGHHCAHPLMRKLGIPATVRASLSVYNTRDEIDYFIDKLKTTMSFFA
ncbi:MAG: SufS family cysteine desulfurase [Spirochaetales bacterium]|nr:SufS family cysteine desulfurase [Spirochaetales bacterium]